MRSWSLTATILILVLASLPAAAPAATVEVFSQEVRVQSTAPGVALIITDFWDKPVEFAFARLRAGRWTYLVKYKAIFRVQARDLTAEELRALEVEARLRQLEETLDAVRDQVRVLCEQLGWRGPGCP
jgi:hypothetical protein